MRDCSFIFRALGEKNKTPVREVSLKNKSERKDSRPQTPGTVPVVKVSLRNLPPVPKANKLKNIAPYAENFTCHEFDNVSLPEHEFMVYLKYLMLRKIESTDDTFTFLRKSMADKNLIDKIIDIQTAVQNGHSEDNVILQTSSTCYFTAFLKVCAHEALQNSLSEDMKNIIQAATMTKQTTLIKRRGKINVQHHEEEVQRNLCKIGTTLEKWFDSYSIVRKQIHNNRSAFQNGDIRVLYLAAKRSGLIPLDADLDVEYVPDNTFKWRPNTNWEKQIHEMIVDHERNNITSEWGERRVISGAVEIVPNNKQFGHVISFHCTSLELVPDNSQTYEQKIYQFYKSTYAWHDSNKYKMKISALHEDVRQFRHIDKKLIMNTIGEDITLSILYFVKRLPISQKIDLNYTKKKLFE